MRFPKFFRSKAALKRDSYISSFLAPPSQLSGELLDWSSGTDMKIRRLAMRFHQEWQHPDCLVMKWYKTHAVTSFTSIQHWQNKDTQFFHEFLIIQLTDGSACRLERIGEGPRPDAVRRTGCNAYDLIQWFSPEDNLTRTWSTGHNEMIVQVDFPCTFDLLDVISICHTIQCGFKKTSVYTLQRYNCYFLCCTILVILTRRFETWEKLITHNTWTEVMNKTLNDLRHVPLILPEEQDPVDYFVLGICSLVSSDSFDPAGFLVHHIELGLTSVDHDATCDALKDVLWHGKLGDTLLIQVYTWMDDDFLDAILPLGGSSSNTAIAPVGLANLDALLGEVDKERFPCEDHNFASTRTVISREILAAFTTMVAGIADPILKAQKMEELEIETPLHLRLAASTLGFLLGSSLLQPIAFWLNRGFRKDCETREDARPVRETLQKFSVTVPQLVLAIQPRIRSGLTKFLVYNNFGNGSVFFNEGHLCRLLELFFSIVDQVAERFHKILIDRFRTSSGELNISACLAWVNSHHSRLCWRYCLMRTVTRTLFSNFNHVLQRRNQPTLTVRLTDGTRKEVTVANFQESIHRRILNHSERVDSFQLAAGPLVCSDIERAMTEIWKLLPSENREPKTELEGEENPGASDTESVFTIPSFIFQLPN